MDFGFLPPEVNSGRMYAGPGSGPLLAAAASWDSLSTELGITAAVYESVLSGLTGLYWQGPAAQAMAAGAAPYVAWLHATAERAQQTAMQARAAAAAYELAFAMTVPPSAVTANRTQLATLVATNFFGQNAGAIAATEAQYAEYWAQDAAAMNGYSASSAAAARLSPFVAPRQTTGPDAERVQRDAVARATANASGSNANSGSPGGIVFSRQDQLFRIFDTIQGTSTAFRSLFTSEGTAAGIIQADKNLGILPNLAAAPSALPKAPALSGAASGVGNVNAVLARAGRIGSMSVPAGWAAATGNPVAAVPGSGLSDLAATEAVARTGSGTPGIPGIPGGTARRATLVVPRYGRRIMVMTRPPAAG